MSEVPPSSPMADEETKRFASSRHNSISGLQMARLLQPSAAPTSAATEQGIECDNDNVKVCCRIRPFNEREIKIHQKDQESLSPRSQYPMRSVMDMKGRDTIFLDASADHTERERFAFDESLWSISDEQQTSANPLCTQADVFTLLGAPVLRHAWKGFNSCVFAYGQTGSGKTYTMMGSDDDPGLIPRICTRLFEEVAARKAEIERNANPLQEVTLQVEVRFMEIYIEKVHDLLAENTHTNAEPLRVRHHPTRGPFVEGLTAVTVTSWEDCKRLIDIGNAERITAETKMNERSSRSHAVFKLTFIQTTKSIPTNKFERATVNERYSHISLVDLAGSERNKKSEAQGIHLTEAANINKSLSTLKKVIDALVELSEVKNAKKKPKTTIPFRESTLTWLLSDNLGGNSKTTMLCTVSPHVDNAEESLLTLRYGLRARGIVCNVRVNEDTQAKQILELQNRLKDLQGQAELAAADDTKDLLLDEIEVGRRAIEEMQKKIVEEEERSRGLSEVIQKERMARYQGAYYQSFRFLIAKKQSKEKEVTLIESMSEMKENLAAAVDRLVRLETERNALDQKVRTMGSDNDSLTLQLDQAKVKIVELQKENHAIGSHITDTRDKDQALTRYRDLMSVEEERRRCEVSELQTRVCIAKMLGAFHLRRQKRAFERLVLKQRAEVEVTQTSETRDHQRKLDSLTTIMADMDQTHSDEVENLEKQHSKEIRELNETVVQCKKTIAELEGQVAAKEAEELRQRKKWEERCKAIADEWFSKHEEAKAEYEAELKRVRSSYENALEDQEKQFQTDADERLADLRRVMLTRIEELTTALQLERSFHDKERSHLQGEHEKVVKSQEMYIDDMRDFVKMFCNKEDGYKQLHARITAVLHRKDFDTITKEGLRDLLISYSTEYERNAPVPITVARFSKAGRGEFACERPPIVGVNTPVAKSLSPQPRSVTPMTTPPLTSRVPVPTTNAGGRIPIRRQQLKVKIPTLANNSF
jgi:hypothetical protein